jgi:hypothetical protein
MPASQSTRAANECSPALALAGLQSSFEIAPPHEAMGVREGDHDEIAKSAW